MPSVATNSPIILCVDDEKLPLDLRHELLSRQGYRVLLAHTGESALQMFRAIDVDLVISDNRFPDIAGSDIIGEMKRLRPMTPIMMLSGLSEPPTGTKIDAFVTKGLPMEEFLAAVATLLGG